MSTLSILIVAQDEENVIPWTMESCLHTSQILGSSLREIVVVDGGSKDHTMDIVNAYKDKMPIKLLQRPWDFTRAQMNYGLDNCTGDYVMPVDADMTWTTNFPHIFLSGRYDQAAFWDFRMLFTCVDAYHYFNWPIGVNMRLFRSGRRFKEDRKYHWQVDGQTHGIPVCGDVIIFENSCRIKDEKALLHRGERRQTCISDMAAEGASPGAPDRFLMAARTSENQKMKLSDDLINLVLPSTNG